MITLTQSTNQERARVNETKRPSETVETAGSLAMLFENGLLTMGQYDEFISSNPFAVDYGMYANFESADVAYSGFLGDFASAVSTLGDMGTGFSDGGSFVGSCSSGSCGGFSSVC